MNEPKDNATVPSVDDVVRRPCEICNELYEDDSTRCAGCGRKGCDECIQYCAPDYDMANGDYFCEGCRE